MLHNDLPMRDTAIAGPRTWLLVDRNEAREFLEPVEDKDGLVYSHEDRRITTPIPASQTAFS